MDTITIDSRHHHDYNDNKIVIMRERLNRKKKHPIYPKHTQVTSTPISSSLDTPVYFLIGDSPANIYSREYSTVYELLQTLFGSDPIPQDEAVEAIHTLGLNAESTLSWMTRHHYLHRARLEEVLK